MDDWQNMSHVRWDCRCHIVFVPKYRKKYIREQEKAETGQNVLDFEKE